MSNPALHTAAAGPEAHQHLVGFYETERYLVETVAGFLAPALRDGGAAMVIATPEHREAIAAELSVRGVDATTGDRYVALDAASTVASFTIDGALDADRFEEVIGELIERLAGIGRPVLAYGEMVSLLWSAGDGAGALELEELWNGLCRRAPPFSLLCGYPISTFANDTDIGAFEAVCDAHGAILPPEPLSSFDGSHQGGRSVAVLRQEAVAGAYEREALRRKQEQSATALERLAEVDRVRRRFVAMVVHDIRNPTDVIAGLLDLLRDAWPSLEPQEVSDLLTTASRSTTKIQRLLDDVLLMSRIESGHFAYDVTALDLAGIITEVAADLRSATGRSIEVVVPERVRPALADAGRQTQILANLLSNATKFSGGDTTVTVTLRDLGDQLAVDVRDEGVGIAASDLDKLFLPFSRVQSGEEGTTGTGLGLFISKAMVEGQGGRITVESEAGAGALFTYTVPTASSPVEPSG